LRSRPKAIRILKKKITKKTSIIRHSRARSIEMISSVTVDVLKKVSCNYTSAAIKTTSYWVYYAPIYICTPHIILFYIPRYDIITKQGNSSKGSVYVHYFEKFLLFLHNSIHCKAAILIKILYIFVIIFFRCFLF